MSKNTILKTIELANTGKQYPVLDVVRSNPELAATISKLISPAQPAQYNNKGERTIATPNTYQFRNISWKTARNAADAKTTMQMLPDMELSAQILVSSILSPKDMMTTELIFQAPEDVVPAQISNELLTHIRTHFEQVYKIKPMLGKILRDVLFERGSYIAAVIPENSLDELINRHTAVTLESVSDLVDSKGKIRPLGILGPNQVKEETNDPEPAISMEDFKAFDVRAVRPTIDGQVQMHLTPNSTATTANPYLLVTDNPDVLKLPKLKTKLTNQRISSLVGGLNPLQRSVQHNAVLAMEAARHRQGVGTREKRLTERELGSVLYKDTSRTHQEIALVKTQEQVTRRPVALPLIMELPPEAVIPVHVPGQEDKHIGYFILLDMNGHPINSNSDKDYYNELSDRMNSNSSSSFPGQLTSRIQSMYTGFDCSNREHLDYSARVYADMVEQDLMARLRNGVYTNGVSLGRNEEVYRIMLARTLAKQQTQLLFMPVELVTYFAFRFNADGIGKSLMEDMKVLNSLRSIMMFSNVMAGVRNSVGQTNVKIKLDERDPDPTKTIDMTISEIIRARQQSFPLGTNSPVDLVNWLQRAGYNFTFEGHPDIPDVGIDFSESNTNYPKPDAELEENLRKRSILATGLNPETVDNGFNGEFATSVVANNILLSRRVMQIQEQFTPLLTDHLRKVAMASPDLIDSMRQTIANGYEKIKLDEEIKKEIVGGQVDEKAAIVEYILLEFLRGIEVELPKPNTVTLENQSTAFESYVKMLDQLLDAWISDSIITTEVAGNVGENVATIRNIVRAYYIRKWQAENGVMPELSEITATDEDGEPSVNFWESHQNHVKSLVKSMGKLMVELEPVKQASDTILAAKTNIEGGGGAQDESSFGSDTGGGGGDDDFGLGGLDDTPADDSASTETTETVEESSTTTTTNTAEGGEGGGEGGTGDAGAAGDAAPAA